MQEKNIYGIINGGKININIGKNNYIDDSELLIVLDGRYSDKTYIEKIRELYIEFGEKFLYQIDDFFSMYLYDKKNDILILSRDRMGLKSVYYYVNNNVVYFGNDIMLIVDNYNLKKEINKKVLSMYFKCHYINPPETIFKNIYKLEHGSYLIYKNNKIEIKKYWDEIQLFNINSQKTIKNKKQIKEELNKILSNNIKEFLKTENNFCIYLSGGIDSSLVTALCKKYSPQKITTFSIGFYDENQNEAQKSKRIADYLGTNHHELYIEKDKIIKLIKKIPKYYTEPFGDSSAFPAIILNELSKEHSIETAFTGDGADQLFCGSRLYDKLYKLQLLHKLLNPLNIHLNLKKRRLIYIYGNTNKQYQSQFEDLAYIKHLKGLLLEEGNNKFEQEKDIKSKNWQEKRMILDIGTFMADRVSVKMGIASNKNGLEIRTPFFCKNVIDYTFKIPHNLKYHKKIKKYILKEILYDYIPKDFFNNEKNGFGIPINKWLQMYLFEDLKRVSKKSFIEKQNIFNYKVINRLIKDIDNREISQILWDFYIFQLWYCEYML